MSCIYDEKKFQEFRKLAVTDPSKLVPGKVYYTNRTPKAFVFRGFKPHSKNWAWIMPITNDHYSDNDLSLFDRNCGRSYNPWMIFEDEEVRDRCLKELTVKIVHDGL